MSEPLPLSADTWYKNQLQEYAQRASMGLPIYKTIGEGPSHAPQFRSVVWIDGTCFTSPLTYTTRKVAEQEAAKFAFVGIRQKVKNEASSRVLADTAFCKSIISEYAVKMNLGAPTYVTKETKAILPIFVSTLSLNGVAYVGDAAKNKKEAEQFAARSAVKSILDSESSTTMSEIVRSKFKFYDALKNGKDSIIMNSVSMPAITNTSEGSDALSSVDNKRKEANVSGGTVTLQLAPIPESSPSGPFPAIQGTSAHLAPILESGTSGPTLAKQLPHLQQVLQQQVNLQAARQPFHEFKRHKPQTSSAEVELPILFVPATAEQAPGCSAAARKRKRKKERKRAQLLLSLPMVRIPQNPPLEPSTAQ